MASPNGENNCLLTDPKKTGEWLSMRLKDNRVLEHELADMLDVSYARVINWTSGKRGMRLHTIMTINIVLGAQRDYKVARIEAMQVFKNLKP